MPRISWRGVVVAVVSVCAVAVDTGAVRGQDSLFPPPSVPADPPALLPSAPGLPPVATGPHPPVKDLTPPGFASEAYHPPADYGWYNGHDALGGHDAHGGHGEVPGHLNPAAPEHGGVFATAEFLLLRPRRGAFDFAIPSTAGGLSTTGPVRSLNYELRAGVRTELGYRFASGWEVSGGYTYFHSSAFDAGFAPAGNVVLPTLTRPGLTNTALFAGADANLDYNVYDLLFGRRVAVDDHVAVRAFAGVRFASIHQCFNAFYDGIDARAAAVSAPSAFEGFGPVVGGEAVWAGVRGFHLYARVNGGVLTGPADNPLRETNSAGRTVYVNTAYDVRKTVPFAGVGVGAGWQYRTVSLRVGYEITHWFGLIDQPRFVDDVARGAVLTRPANLSLEGLFVQAGLAF